MVRTESGDRIAGIAGTGSEEYSSGTYSSGLPFTKRKNVLIEQFGIGGISTADEDIMKFLS